MNLSTISKMGFIFALIYLSVQITASSEHSFYKKLENVWNNNVNFGVICVMLISVGQIVVEKLSSFFFGRIKEYDLVTLFENTRYDFIDIGYTILNLVYFKNHDETTAFGIALFILALICVLRILAIKLKEYEQKKPDWQYCKMIIFLTMIMIPGVYLIWTQLAEKFFKKVFDFLNFYFVEEFNPVEVSSMTLLLGKHIGLILVGLLSLLMNVIIKLYNHVNPNHTYIIKVFTLLLKFVFQWIQMVLHLYFLMGIHDIPMVTFYALQRVIIAAVKTQKALKTLTDYVKFRKSFEKIENYIPSEEEEKEEDEDLCVVCMHEMTEGKVLPCSHHFHFGCLENWILANKKECPVCKKTFNEDEKKKEEKQKKNKRTLMNELLKDITRDIQKKSKVDDFEEQILFGRVKKSNQLCLKWGGVKEYSLGTFTKSDQEEDDCLSLSDDEQSETEIDNFYWKNNLKGTSENEESDSVHTSCSSILRAYRRKTRIITKNQRTALCTKLIDYIDQIDNDAQVLNKYKSLLKKRGN